MNTKEGECEEENIDESLESGNEQSNDEDETENPEPDKEPLFELNKETERKKQKLLDKYKKPKGKISVMKS